MKYFIFEPRCGIAPLSRKSWVRIPLKPWFFSFFFFQSSSFQLLKLENLLQWSFFTFIDNRSSNMNYFIHNSHHFTSLHFGLWRTGQGGCIIILPPVGKDHAWNWGSFSSNIIRRSFASHFHRVTTLSLLKTFFVLPGKSTISFFSFPTAYFARAILTTRFLYFENIG